MEREPIRQAQGEQDILPPLPGHAEYDRLQTGEIASMNKILQENTDMAFAIQQQLMRSHIIPVEIIMHPESGELQDISLQRKDIYVRHLEKPPK